MKSSSRFPSHRFLLLLVTFAFAFVPELTQAAAPRLSLDSDGTIDWTNAAVPGVMTLLRADSLPGSWSPSQSYFTTTSVNQARVSLTSSPEFFQLLASDISGTPEGHTNLLHSYGILETIAGTGRFDNDKQNNWKPEFEWGPATDADLSRPHIAFAQPDNNLLLVDEGSSSILRITTNGLIHTFAGTHVNGFNGDGPAPATNLHLNFPNGGHMAGNGTFYVMDTYNSRIRRIDTNGIMTTLFEQPVPNQFRQEGRGLWVREDESEVWFCAGTTLERWTPEGGVELMRSGFLDLGNIVGDELHSLLYVTDRDQQSVFTYNLTNNVMTRIAGNGTQSGGGDGFPALQTGLARPRTVVLLPNGGFLIGEHSPGYRVWYVDPAGIIHLWMAGGNDAHSGDGAWFYESFGTPKNGKVRAMNMDRRGNLILVVNDLGWVRRVRFERLFLPGQN